MGLKVAVIGAGFTGATAALTLAQASAGLEVTLYDQGRRGPGGRASHRLVDASSGAVLTEGTDQSEAASATLRFDHGCQFFTAASDRFRGHVDGWTAAGVATAWKGRFTGLPDGGDSPGPDFFDSSSGLPLYTGRQGMDKIVKHISSQAVAAGVKLQTGVRVSAVEKLSLADSTGTAGGQWKLIGVDGEAAFHDSDEAVAAKASHSELGLADVLVLTDASCSFGGWHRASAGISSAAPDITRAVQSRARVPLFTAMVAFSARIELDCDSLVVRSSDSKLWYAARSGSKADMKASKEAIDCWTLVSTPKFAVDEISSTTMQDPTTGAFRPQDNSYLNGEGGPSKQLLEAFAAAVRDLRAAGGRDTRRPLPATVYLQGQRWGSAFPSPLCNPITTQDDHVHYFTDTGETAAGRVRVLDVLYDSATPSLSRLPGHSSGGSTDGHNFFMDRRIGLYYAGDFCSRDTPGVEAATLSGEDAAFHVIANYT